MAYAKKPTPFEMRSPLNLPEDGSEKTKKSIPYYSASSNVLSFDQNNRLKKIFRDPNQKGKVFKSNDGNYYPSDRFTANKDNTGVTLNKGYSYGKGGLLSSAAKGVENPKGNLVSRNAGDNKNLASNNINPFAGTNNSGKAGVSGYRTGSTASNPEGKKLGEGIEKTKNPFPAGNSSSKPSSFLSGFGLFPSRETPTMGSTVISQSSGSKISPDKKGNYLENSFDVNTSTTGNPTKTNSSTGFKTSSNSKSNSGSGASVNASSLIPKGGFGTGGKLNTSGRPDFNAVNSMLSKATNNKNKKNNTPVSSNNNTSTSNDRNIKPISVSDDFKKENASNISKTSNIVKKAMSSEDNNIPSYAPRSRRDKIIDRQNRKTDRTVERVGNSIERIKGRQQRSGVREAGRDIRRSDAVKNESYNQTMKSAVPGANKSATNLTFGKLPNSSIGKNAATQPKPSSSLSKNTGTTTGSIAPGPAVNVSKSNSLSFNLSSSIPKPKLKTNAATTVSANSKTPELRGLGAKNQKSVNKSSKKATKKANKDNKRSTKSLTATAMGGNNSNITDKMPGGKKSKTFGI